MVCRNFKLNREQSYELSTGGNKAAVYISSWSGWNYCVRDGYLQLVFGIRGSNLVGNNGNKIRWQFYLRNMRALAF